MFKGFGFVDIAGLEFIELTDEDGNVVYGYQDWATDSFYPADPSTGDPSPAPIQVPTAGATTTTDWWSGITKLITPISQYLIQQQYASKGIVYNPNVKPGTMPGGIKKPATPINWNTMILIGGAALIGMMILKSPRSSSSERKSKDKV